MATWIVHLRLTENILDLIPNLDAGQFAVGNVAPDSGVPDENWENFDPPPPVTHFLSPEKEWVGSADLDFYRKHLVDITPEKEPERFSFRLGYFYHLLTDNLWREKVYRPTKAHFQEEFLNNPNFNSDVKKDWYGLDLAYVCNNPECLFWRVFLDAQPTFCDLDFLPMSAVNQQLNHIKFFYQRDDDEINNHYRPSDTYLTQEDVDKFVAETTQRLYRVYQALWDEKTPVPDEKSILTIVL